MLNPVQQSKSGSGNTASLQIVLDSNVVKRSLIWAIFRVKSGGGSIASVDDNQLNYYGSPIVSGTDGAGNTLAIYVSMVSTWGALTVTATLSGSAHITGSISEIPNYVHHIAGSPVTNTGTSSSPDTGTIAIPASTTGSYMPRHIVFAAFSHNGGSPVTQSPGSGWTSNAGSSVTSVTDSPLMVAWQTDVPDSTTRSAPFAGTGSSVAWQAVGVTLKHCEYDGISRIAWLAQPRIFYGMDQPALSTNITDYSVNRLDGTASLNYTLGVPGFFAGRTAIQFQDAAPWPANQGRITPNARYTWPGNTPYCSFTWIKWPSTYANQYGGRTMGVLDGIGDTAGSLLGVPTGFDGATFEIDPFNSFYIANHYAQDEWVFVATVDDGTNYWGTVMGFPAPYSADSIIPRYKQVTSQGASRLPYGSYSNPNIFVGWNGYKSGAGNSWMGIQGPTAFVDHIVTMDDLIAICNSGPNINPYPCFGDSVLQGMYATSAGVSQRRIPSRYARSTAGGRPTYSFSTDVGNDVANFGHAGITPPSIGAIFNHLASKTMVSYSRPLAFGFGYNNGHVGMGSADAHGAEEALMVQMCFPSLSPNWINWDDGRISLGTWAYKQYVTGGQNVNNITLYQDLYQDAIFSSTVNDTMSFTTVGANLYLIMGTLYGNGGTTEVKVDGVTKASAYPHTLAINDANTNGVASATVLKISGLSNTVPYTVTLKALGGGDSIFIRAISHDTTNPLATKPIVTYEMGGANNGWVGGQPALNNYRAGTKAVLDTLKAAPWNLPLRGMPSEVDWATENTQMVDGVHPDTTTGFTRLVDGQIIPLERGIPLVTLNPPTLSGTSGVASSNVTAALDPAMILSPGADLTVTVSPSLTGGATASSSVTLTSATSSGTFTITATTNQTPQLSEVTTNTGILDSPIVAPSMSYSLSSTYTLTAVDGLFSLTGENVITALSLFSVNGYFSLTGESIGFTSTLFLLSLNGSFSLTGENALLTATGDNPTPPHHGLSGIKALRAIVRKRIYNPIEYDRITFHMPSKASLERIRNTIRNREE